VTPEFGHTSQEIDVRHGAVHPVLGRQTQTHENSTYPGFVTGLAFQDLISLGQALQKVFPV
jgi:hypothetical protein